MHGIMPRGRDPAVRKRVAEYYKAGVSAKALAKRYRISDTTIQKILDEFKIPRRSGGAEDWL